MTDVRKTFFQPTLSLHRSNIRVGDACTRQSPLKQLERNGTVALALNVTRLANRGGGPSRSLKRVIEAIVGEVVRWVIVVLVVGGYSQAAHGAAVVASRTAELRFYATICSVVMWLACMHACAQKKRKKKALLVTFCAWRGRNLAGMILLDSGRSDRT